MNYIIQNQKLTVEISSRGGEFRSVKDAQGRDYLWQGDASMSFYFFSEIVMLHLLRYSFPLSSERRFSCFSRFSTMSLRDGSEVHGSIHI